MLAPQLKPIIDIDMLCFIRCSICIKLPSLVLLDRFFVFGPAKKQKVKVV